MLFKNLHLLTFFPSWTDIYCIYMFGIIILLSVPTVISFKCFVSLLHYASFIVNNSLIFSFQFSTLLNCVKYIWSVFEFSSLIMLFVISRRYFNIKKFTIFISENCPFPIILDFFENFYFQYCLSSLFCEFLKYSSSLCCDSPFSGLLITLIFF